MDDRIIEMHEKGYKYREENYKYCFDLDKWRESDGYKLIKKHSNKQGAIIEVGCLSGHHLLLLEQDGYTDLTGVDFVADAIKWGKERGKNINFLFNVFNNISEAKPFDTFICFDVLEHQHNIYDFFLKIRKLANTNARILFLVPKGKEYFDKCHVNFYPDTDCLKNLLDIYFKVEEIYEVEDGKKIFAKVKIK